MPDQLTLFDLADDDQPRARRKSVELFTMQQVDRYKHLGAELCCTCSDSPRAQIAAIRSSQGAFQVKVAGANYWITPPRVWAEMPGAAPESESEVSNG